MIDLRQDSDHGCSHALFLDTAGSHSSTLIAVYLKANYANRWVSLASYTTSPDSQEAHDSVRGAEPKSGFMERLAYLLPKVLRRSAIRVLFYEKNHIKTLSLSL